MEGTRNTGRLRAIIYIVGGREQTDRWVAQCLTWVEHCGYHLIAILTEQDDEKRPSFAAGLDMLTESRADVMVVATSDYLPGDWVPRIEVAGDDSEPFAVPPENRPPDPPRQRRARPARRHE